MAAQALRAGLSVEDIHDACKFDPWFLRELERIVDAERDVAASGLPHEAGALRRLKALGFSDKRLAELTGNNEDAVAALRARLGVRAGLQAYRHLRRRVRLAPRPTCIRPTKAATARRSAKPIPPTARRSSSSAADRTASARASSSTIAASTPPMR